MVYYAITGNGQDGQMFEISGIGSIHIKQNAIGIIYFSKVWLINYCRINQLKKTSANLCFVYLVYLSNTNLVHIVQYSIFIQLPLSGFDLQTLLQRMVKLQIAICQCHIPWQSVENKHLLLPVLIGNLLNKNDPCLYYQMGKLKDVVHIYCSVYYIKLFKSLCL